MKAQRWFNGNVQRGCAANELRPAEKIACSGSRHQRLWLILVTMQLCLPKWVDAGLTWVCPVQTPHLKPVIRFQCFPDLTNLHRQAGHVQPKLRFIITGSDLKMQQPSVTAAWDMQRQ